MLRPKLYKKYCGDMNLSFFFFDKQVDEKSDEEIAINFANR